MALKFDILTTDGKARPQKIPEATHVATSLAAAAAQRIGL